MTTSPAQTRRITPTKSSIWAVDTGGSPNAFDTRSIPRPKPSEKRPAVNRCMVIAYAAVTIGCRVW